VNSAGNLAAVAANYYLSEAMVSVECSVFSIRSGMNNPATDKSIAVEFLLSKNPLNLTF